MKIRLLLLLSIVIFFSACEKDEEITTDPDARLSFSIDSILFDTVFTSVGSASRRLKIYNPNPRAVLITQIRLGGGNTSAYSLNINGQAGSETSLLKLNGRDSMNIFIKVNINPDDQKLPFLVKDSIGIFYQGQRQNIPLVAYGQNANFIVNGSIKSNTTWDNRLPYIIYKSLSIEEGATLQIQPGSKILFHRNATMNIKGTLSVNGTRKDSVVFASDRLEQLYAEEPGQWNGLHFYPQSKNNHIHHAIIKNAVVGITCDSLSTTREPKLLLTNSMVKNMTVVGFLGYQTSLAGFNNLFHNCGQYLLYVAGGGKYDLKQNTFAGFSLQFARKSPSLYFTDYISSQQANHLELVLQNNLIWGSLPDELTVEKKATGTNIVTDIRNNLIRSSNSAYAAGNNILNINPGFVNVTLNNFHLSTNSPALNKGLDLQQDHYFDLYLARDLKNNERLFPSELGCYENN